MLMRFSLMCKSSCVASHRIWHLLGRHHVLKFKVEYTNKFEFLPTILAIWMSRIGIVLCTYASLECFGLIGVFGCFGSFGWATRLPAAIAELSFVLVVSSSETSKELFLAVDNWLCKIWYVNRYFKFIYFNRIDNYPTCLPRVPCHQQGMIGK